MNTTQFPPGGWVFYQPQTGWHAPFPTAMTHDQQTTNIIKHRMANQAITMKHKLATDFASVSAELIQFQVARGAIPQTEFPKPTPPPGESPLLVGAVADAVNAVKKIASGAALLMEWQESGQAPVLSETSQKRALTCTECPKNDREGLSKYFTSAISENIRQKLSKLHEMNLTTPSDGKLGVCQACLCPLRLKVHTPLDLIVKRLKPEARAELDLRCWILHEST